MDVDPSTGAVVFAAHEGLCSGRAKWEKLKGREIEQFSPIFADFGIISTAPGDSRVGDSQMFAANRRFWQEPLPPICCLPFGTLLCVSNEQHMSTNESGQKSGRCNGIQLLGSWPAPQLTSVA